MILSYMAFLGQHTIRGATKEKSKKLDELKARRRAKDEKRASPSIVIFIYHLPHGLIIFIQSHEPSRRDRSDSPMDMETDDEDEEDGQIGREEQEEERERRLLSGGQPKAPADNSPLTIDDLKKVWVTRDLIAKHCMAPWFEDYVKGMFVWVSDGMSSSYKLRTGAYVRYLIGNEDNRPVYRLCEVHCELFGLWITCSHPNLQQRFLQTW